MLQFIYKDFFFFFIPQTIFAIMEYFMNTKNKQEIPYVCIICIKLELISARTK